MACPKSWKTVEIEQQASFGFTEENIEKLLSDWSTVKDYAYITHSKPIEDVDTHSHLMLRFKDSCPTTAILNKCKSCGITITEQQLERCKKWESAVAYLTHENVDKPKYPRSLIKSNFDFDSVIDKEVQRKNATHDKARACDIVQQIADGIIKEYNLHNYLSVIEYNTYKKDIDTAFIYRANLLRNEVNRSMECVFITGDSGVGKTTFAKNLAKEHNYDVFVSSSSNDVLDGYGGQPCIILDDLRPSALGLADLLKLLDNNTNSSVKSRYKNKVLECQLIIVTTTLAIDDFFKNVFTEQPETIVQLKRRCQLMFNMTKTSIKTYIYNNVKRDYELVGNMDNYILLQFKSLEELKKEEQFDIAKKMLGSMGDMLKNVSNNLEEFMPVDDKDNVFKLLDN